MNQATKDRLFTLGLEIPEGVQAQGTEAVNDWAAEQIENALQEGGEKAEQLAAVQAREDLGVYAGLAEDDPGEGESSAVEFMRSLEIPLVELLDNMATGCAELAELATKEGDEAVFARLGNLPAWSEFRTWADAVTAAPGGDQPPLEVLGVDVPVEVVEAMEEPDGPGPALGSPGLAEVSAPPPPPPESAGEDAPDTPDSDVEELPEAEPHTPEKVADLAADLERREETDASARAEAEVVTTDEPGGTSAADPPLAPAEGTSTWEQVSSLNTRVKIAESDLGLLDAALKLLDGRLKDAEADLRAVDELTDRLELPLHGGPVHATALPDGDGG